MSSFLMFVAYKKSLFFRGSTSSDCGFNLLSLSGVLLKTAKTYQPHNLWYILMVEVPHGFTLACNQRLGINHSSSLLLSVRYLSIKEHPYCFRFFCLVHDMFNCLADGKNRTVQFWLGCVVSRWAIAKVEMANDAATGFGKD